ncbi:unnamed protein product [Pleuronectes platessa]|uniref:Uncharacterized protein n=1 Tax=Pleuronectes platessa TaxID=8262 RepID=A0A9N7THI9_PLEPL|nr:unnamed protein product [Pleuronectes platessa]
MKRLGWPAPAHRLLINMKERGAFEVAPLQSPQRGAAGGAGLISPLLALGAQVEELDPAGGERRRGGKEREKNGGRGEEGGRYTTTAECDNLIHPYSDPSAPSLIKLSARKCPSLHFLPLMLNQHLSARRCERTA